MNYGSGACIFDPFLTQFCSREAPFSRHFGSIHGQKRISTASKLAKSTSVSIPNGLGSLLEKGFFETLMTHFWSPNDPFSWHVGSFYGPQHGTRGSKRAKNTCLSIPGGLGTSWGETYHFALRAQVNPPLARTVGGLGCPLYRPMDQRYSEVGVSLGDSEAWKPQKEGGCGWIWYPCNRVSSNVAQDTTRSWFWGC